ncbi:MAG: hypothetical protein HY335_04450 [Deinococcus sp.]|nr:hypothetical protein [Deinococcus sp.]
MPEGELQTTEKPTAAFIFSLLAGVWMLAAGGLMYGFNWEDMMAGWQGMGGWMLGHGMMRNFAPALWWPWFGFIAGIAVVTGAAMLYNKPEQRSAWGVVVLVVSALNFFIGMGGLIASALGVIGGVLALTNRTGT